MRAIAASALLVLAACAPHARAPAADRVRASHASRPLHGGGDRRGALLGEYDVRYDGSGTLSVEATLDRPGPLFGVEDKALRFLSDVEVAGPDGRFARAGEGGKSFVAPACGTGQCRLRYRYALRDAAKALDDLDLASEEGSVLEAPPSTWLLAPEEADVEARLRFRVTTLKGTSFVTGVLRSHEAADAWDIALRDLWTAPYSAFGPLRMRTIDAAGARVDLAVAPGKLDVSDDDLVHWTDDASKAVVGYYGRYPLPEALVLVVPGRGRWVGEGKTLAGGGGSIFIRVGEHAPLRALHEDWVLVHEMTHLTFPSVAREHDWAEEGLATYVEPIARARAGIMTTAEAWRSLVEGLPNGLPAAGDAGLDHTPTWGRTYWGGALFYLLADIEIRERTNNRLGLEHALRGILEAGGNNANRWELEDAFAAGDKATGVPVLHELHAAMGSHAHPVDLPALWKRLGIAMSRGTVRFDDAAPLAEIRTAIMRPSP
jgi:hypothetical protein